MYGINYQPPTYKELFEEYIRKAAANNLLNNNPEYIQNLLRNEEIENILVMEFAIHAEMLNNIYQKLNTIHQAQDLEKATAEDLDILLSPYIPRQDITYAETIITFKTEENLTEPLIIEEETCIKTLDKKPIRFQTQEKLTISPGQNIGQVLGICTIPGPLGNITEKTLKILETPIKGIKEVYNPYSATGGREREDDESYRQKGRKWARINTQGTYDAVKNTLEEINTVERYLIQPCWNGPGTTRILIDPPLPEVLETVEIFLEDVKALNEQYTIIGIKQKPININIKANITLETPSKPIEFKKEILEEDIKKALRVYVEGGIDKIGKKVKGLGLGMPFIPSRAAAYLLNTLPFLQDLTITQPLNIIEVQPDQRIKIGELHVTFT